MKGLCLLSGGIDSIVSAYLVKKTGVKVDFLHFRVFENNRDEEEKIKSLAKKIGGKIFFASHKKMLLEFQKKCETKFICVFCKKTMLIIADEFAKKNMYDFIITGDNLGQVASQTLKNMKFISQGIETPILRPLLGLDKQEIIDIAKKIGTYELSIKHALPCPFLPKRIVTKVNEKKYAKEIKKIDFKKMVNESLSTIEEISR